MIGASLNNQQYSFEAEVVTADVKLNFASDVATLSRGNKRAVASIVSNGDGTVDIVFNHKFTTFLGMAHTWVNSSGNDINVTVKSINLSTKTIVIAITDPTDGLDPDPVPDGDLYLNFRFGMSAVNMG